MNGRLIIEEHLTYLDALDRLDTFASFFAHLPDRVHAPDARWLETATVAPATPKNPQAPVQQYLERVEEFRTDYIRMLAPVLGLLFHHAHAKLGMEGTYTELVMSSATIERARDLIGSVTRNFDAVRWCTRNVTVFFQRYPGTCGKDS